MNGRYDHQHAGAFRYPAPMAKDPIALRPLEAGDDSALLAIQHATTGDTPAWSPALLQQLFRDPAHRGGANAVVAQRTGTIVGAAGWVAAGAEFFGSPVLAIDEETADVLIDHVIAQRMPLTLAREHVVDELERRYVEAVLAEHEGNVSRAAIASGIGRRYFHKLLKAHNAR